MNWFRRELQVLNVNIFSDQFEICEDRKIIVIILLFIYLFRMSLVKRNTWGNYWRSYS
jgi:hypothetical protein